MSGREYKEPRTVLGYQGQGTHETAMGEELAAYPEAQEVFDEADQESQRLIGAKITDILNGPPEALAENSQLAIFVVSAASTAVLLKRIRKHPFGVTGHSLGEYAALLASGVFSLKSGMEIICERQKAMKAANDQVPGGGAMAAISGLDEEGIVALAQRMDIDVAAVNTASTGTVSGPRSVVEKVPEEAGSLEEKARAVVLDISSAAHSRWNALAAKIMKPALDDVEFKVPKFHFFANNGQVIYAPEEIKQHLLDMFSSPVRFKDVSELIAASGVKRFTEVGRKKLLSKFVERTAGPQIDTEISSRVMDTEN